MKIIFVCTGNSCRSPMAEALARDTFRKMNLGVDVSSAGVSVLMSLPASENAIDVMRTEYRLDISEHRTRQITREDLVGADIVLCMTERHKGYLALQAPDMQRKCYTLAAFAGREGDIPDPFGGGLEDYRHCATQISSMIDAAAARIKQEKMSKLAVACDHGGLSLKRELCRYMDRLRINYKDLGTDTDDPVDYPAYARKAVDAILSGECVAAVLTCGTGIGISIAANRYRGIRAALCHDVFSAKTAREHNDANILAMGGRVIGPGLACEILEAFINTRFSGDPRHQKRVEMME